MPVAELQMPDAVRRPIGLLKSRTSSFWEAKAVSLTDSEVTHN
jgi:hypothetical protein